MNSPPKKQKKALFVCIEAEEVRETFLVPAGFW